MTYKCAKCREKFEVPRETKDFTCLSCGNVIQARKDTPIRNKPLLLPEPPLPPSPALWGSTDPLPPSPPKVIVQEIPPDPLPEYITPAQARKWGIKISFPKEPA